MGVLLTLEMTRSSRQDLQLFADFLNEVYSPDDISCFLLMRSLIEKELGLKIVSLDKRQIIDLTKIALSRKQARRVFEQFMSDESPKMMEQCFNRFVTHILRTYNSEMIPPYDLMVHGVKECNQIADKKHASIKGVFSQPKSHQSYIDSCFANTLQHSKKLVPNSTQLTFGLQGLDSRTLQPKATNYSGQGVWTCGTWNDGNNIHNKSPLDSEPISVGFHNDSGDKYSNYDKPLLHKRSQQENHDPNKSLSHSSNQWPMVEKEPISYTSHKNKNDYEFESSQKEPYHQTSRQQSVQEEVNHKKSYKGWGQGLQAHGTSVESVETNGNGAYNSVKSLSEQCFQTLKKIISSFVRELMSEEQDTVDEAVVEEVSSIIYHKSKILLKAITRQDKTKWFDQLLIKKPTRSQADYLDSLIEAFDSLLEDYRVTGDAVMHKMQEIGKMILKAPEMTSQIGKLIIHIVENLEDSESRIEQKLDSSIKNSATYSNFKQTNGNDSKQLEKSQTMDALMAHLQEEDEGQQEVEEYYGEEDEEENYKQEQEDRFQSFRNRFNPNSVINEEETDMESVEYNPPALNTRVSTHRGFDTDFESAPALPGRALQDPLINLGVEQLDLMGDDENEDENYLEC